MPGPPGPAPGIPGGGAISVASGGAPPGLRGGISTRMVLPDCAGGATARVPQTLQNTAPAGRVLPQFVHCMCVSSGPPLAAGARPCPRVYHRGGRGTETQRRPEQMALLLSGKQWCAADAASGERLAICPALTSPRNSTSPRAWHPHNWLRYGHFSHCCLFALRSPVPPSITLV